MIHVSCSFNFFGDNYNSVTSFHRSVRVWTDDEKEKLIELMKSYPVFYNSTLPEHKDHTVFSNAKAEVAQHFRNCSMLLLHLVNTLYYCYIVIFILFYISCCINFIIQHPTMF